MSIRRDYRETETWDRYRIRYEREGSTWRAYAELYPHNPYPRSVDSHLLAKDELCVDRSVFNPRDFDEIVAIAVLWMSGFSKYIRTGVFPATGGRVHV
jgi:hypothetical protein